MIALAIWSVGFLLSGAIMGVASAIRASAKARSEDTTRLVAALRSHASATCLNPGMLEELVKIGKWFQGKRL